MEESVTGGNISQNAVSAILLGDKKAVNDLSDFYIEPLSSCTESVYFIPDVYTIENLEPTEAIKQSDSREQLKKIDMKNVKFKPKDTASDDGLTKETCPYCRKHLTRINDHVKLIHGNRVYVCDKPDCGKSFNTIRNLKSHQLVCLNLKKEFKCGTCRKEFHRKSNLINHERRHQAGKFLCDLCERVFVDTTGLRRHFIKHHDNVQTFCISSCCQKKFKSKHGLNKHYKRGACKSQILKS